LTLIHLFVEQRFDLRRFYGISTDWGNTPVINGNDISAYCIIQGRFKLNQPILPGGYSQGGTDPDNSSGWELIGQIKQVPGSVPPIADLDTGLQFLAIIDSNFVFNSGIVPLVPLFEVNDTANVFDSSTFTAPEDGLFRIRIFLRYIGLVNNPTGLGVIIRDETTSTNILIESAAVSTSILNYNYIVNVDLIGGHEYRLYVRNFTFNDITFLPDTNQWVTDNPNGLILPKHHLIESNESAQIYFPSQFFVYGSGYTSYNATMPTYYSALDSETIAYGFQEGSRWRTEAYLDLQQHGVSAQYYGFAAINNYNTAALINSGNSFANTLVINTGSDGFLHIPCSMSEVGLGTAGAFQNSKICGDVIQDGETGGQNYVCENNNVYSSNNDETQCPGCCRHRETLYDNLLVYHEEATNFSRRILSGYQNREYVEGGSALAANIDGASDYFQRCYSSTPNCEYTDPEGNAPVWGPWFPDPDGQPAGYQWWGGGNCEGGTGNSKQRQARRKSWANGQTQYISPVYAAFPSIPPPGDPAIPENLWYVNPNHFTTMSNRFNQVMRTDRLPSSTDLQTDTNGNGYLLHQNGGFAMFIINIDCTFEQEGGGQLVSPESIPLTTDLDFDILGGVGSPIANVAASLTNCSEAVDLNSYYNVTDPVTGNENPAIQPGGNGYSSEPATGADWLWFVRGTGCYNIVSKPLRSLFSHPVPDNSGKEYSDIFTVVEWIQRLKLTFSLCADVYSHTFSNNWINGTLYAFPFQNATIFNSQNQPTRTFCRDTIYFHDPLNTYYYRSSPWNGTDFIGRPRYPSSTENPIGND